MKLLLDTHVVLWAMNDPDRLGTEAREALEDGVNGVFISVVTGWEIAIKQSLGKLDLPRPAEQWLPKSCAALASRSRSWGSPRRCEFADCPGTTGTRSIGCSSRTRSRTGTRS